MTDGKSAQVVLEKGLDQMANDDNSSGPATAQKMKADIEDAGSKIESPTLEKPESEREEIVVSSLATNLLEESYKDILAEKLLGNEDETDDEEEDDDDDNILPGSSQSSVPNGLLEKHKNLLNLFNRMESSIRLLCLRKKMATFKNIATQVKYLQRGTNVNEKSMSVKSFIHALEFDDVFSAFQEVLLHSFGPYETFIPKSNPDK